MPDWPVLGGSSRAAFFPTTNGNTRVFQAAGGAHQKSSWGQLVATLPFDCDSLLLQLWAIGSSSAPSLLMDLGLGASGSEQVLVPNLFFQHASDRLYHPCYLPIAMKAGERLAVRGQTANAGATLDVYLSVVLFARGLSGAPPFGTCTAYGALTASSRGTTLSGVFNQPYQGGTWVELATSVSPAQAIAVIGEQSGFTGSNWNAVVDIGIGASGSEQVLLPGLMFGSQTTQQVFTQPYQGPFPIALPAGQRLVARAGTLDVGSGVNVVVYGFN